MSQKVISISIILLIVLIAGCTQQVSRKDDVQTMRKISGNVIQTSDYCGGAAPTQELIDELQKEKAFPNKKLYIREGNVNLISNPVIKEFLSDENSNFDITLASGQYCIIEDVKKDELKIPDFSAINKQLPSDSKYTIQSEQCFKDWWGGCDKILSVENQDITNFVIKFHHRCSRPCVTGGPIPP